MPITARVNRLSWWVAGIMSLVFTLVLVCAVLGVPPSLFGDPSPMLSYLRIGAIVGAPAGIYCCLYYLNGAIRPQHLTVDDDGVHTPRWHLAWDEIYSASAYPSPGEMSHKQQLLFAVTDEAFARVRRQNRWHSGRPFDMGGLLPMDQTIRCQYAMTPLPGAVALLVQQEVDERNPYRLVPTWARFYRADGAPPAWPPGHPVGAPGSRGPQLTDATARQRETSSRVPAKTRPEAISTTVV